MFSNFQGFSLFSPKLRTQTFHMQFSLQNTQLLVPKFLHLHILEKSWGDEEHNFPSLVKSNLIVLL